MFYLLQADRDSELIRGLEEVCEYAFVGPTSALGWTAVYASDDARPNLQVRPCLQLHDSPGEGWRMTVRDAAGDATTLSARAADQDAQGLARLARMLVEVFPPAADPREVEAVLCGRPGDTEALIVRLSRVLSWPISHVLPPDRTVLLVRTAMGDAAAAARATCSARVCDLGEGWVALRPTGDPTAEATTDEVEALAERLTSAPGSNAAVELRRQGETGEALVWRRGVPAMTPTWNSVWRGPATVLDLPALTAGAASAAGRPVDEDRFVALLRDERHPAPLAELVAILGAPASVLGVLDGSGGAGELVERGSAGEKRRLFGLF